VLHRSDADVGAKRPEPDRFWTAVKKPARMARRVPEAHMKKIDLQKFAGPQRKTRVFFGWMTLLVLLFAAVMFGCYPKRIGPPGVDGKPLTWPEMNLKQRKARMAAVVVPRAGEIFRAWRPERFAKIDCTLCHGQGAVDGDFSMPTAHLPRLSGDFLLGPEFAKHPDTTKLKLNRLVPEMADALGLKSFSLITRRGFGCYSCHLGPEGPLFGN
jgi:hypothetical protein